MDYNLSSATHDEQIAKQKLLLDESRQAIEKLNESIRRVADLNKRAATVLADTKQKAREANGETEAVLLVSFSEH